MYEKTSCSGRNRLPGKLALKNLKKISIFIHIYCSVSFHAIARNADISILPHLTVFGRTHDSVIFFPLQV